MSAELVTIVEVGPRDGLQSLKQQIATDDKIALIDALSQTGLTRIEATSFVNPKWVPQLGDARQVMAGIIRKPGVVYAALTPNVRGVAAAIEAHVGEIAIFASASEAFSQANINCSVAESFARSPDAVSLALGAGLPVRGYLSCITECPFDGTLPPEFVLTQALRLLDLGCYEVSLGDTIGTATPDRVSALLDLLLSHIPAIKLAGHFHDTHNRALGCIETCLGYGLRVFDSSVAGIGGCPYAPGATGNVNTRSVIELAQASGFETRIDVTALAAVERLCNEIISPPTVASC